MFCQWLILVYTLLLSGNPVACVSTCNGPGDERDRAAFINADQSYGWQVSGNTLNVLELSAK